MPPGEELKEERKIKVNVEMPGETEKFGGGWGGGGEEENLHKEKRSLDNGKDCEGQLWLDKKASTGEQGSQIKGGYHPEHS